MFVTLETTSGGQATVNTAYITHVTQLESAYAEAGSCLHFTSDRMVEVKASIAELRTLLWADVAAAETTHEPFVLRT